jgi:hypothetical protein
MIRKATLLTGLALMSLCSFALGETKDKEAAAVESATSWLKILDSGNYAASWSNAANIFKTKVPQNVWNKAASEARGPLGKLISRRLKSKSYTREIPGAPPGEYEIIQFETSFENKKSAIETVTPMLDSDSRWRVSGYFIK